MALSAQTFRNPLEPHIADANIGKFGQYYYMVGTPSPGDLDMQWVGVWKSRDLVNWSGPYLAFEGDKRDKPMWASEIVHKGEEYYIITTCNMWYAGATMMLQKAPMPLGPYTLHSHLKKRGLDPSIFVDTDGRSYLLDSEWIAPLNKEWNWLDGEFLGHRDNKEGPFMVKNNNRYLRFYARIDDGYATEIETFEGDSPYTNDYKEQGEVYTGTFYPGHGCIVPSPDGTELWYASHYMTNDWVSRRLAISPMHFGADGLPVPTVRCLDEQPVPSFNNMKANIALGKPANSSEQDPLAAFDDNAQTSWKSGTQTENSFLEVDLMGELPVERIHLQLPQKSTFSCGLWASCDRLNWQSLGSVSVVNAAKATVTADGGFYRYLRLKDFDTPNVQIAEMQVWQRPIALPQPTGKRVVLQQGNSIVSLKKGQWYDYPSVTIPATGRYDISFCVASTKSVHNRFSLYIDEQRVCSEGVGHTGSAEYWTQIIAFDTHLEAATPRRVRLVADDGEFEVKQIELIEIK